MTMAPPDTSHPALGESRREEDMKYEYLIDQVRTPLLDFTSSESKCLPNKTLSFARTLT